MNICPNVNDPAWKALEAAVGRFEAMKDFMEHNGEIRDPESVKMKLEYRDAPVSKEERDWHEETINNSGLNTVAFRFSNPAYDLTNAMNQNTRAIEIAHKLADELAHQTGIKYQMISAREAQALTAQAKTPWNGEAAFYVGGNVYFVSDKLTTGMVFHEFGHPIVRSLLLTNPELGVKMYGDLEQTVEGRNVIQQVKDNYPELKEETPEFMEEVLVHALEEASDTKYAQLQEPTGFRKFINDLLYRIKQFLRKTFGKGIEVSDLNVNTSINDLANMLTAGNNFNIDTHNIAQEDVASYIRDNSKYMEDLNKLSHPELVAMTNRIYDIATRHIDVVMSNKNYEELVDILANQYSRGDLQEIRANISKYKKQLDVKAAELKNDLEFTRKHTEALVNTLFRLQGMTGKIKLHMEDLVQDPNSQDNLAKGFYYDYLLRYWGEFMDELSHNLDKETGIQSDSPLANLVDTIKRNVSSSRKLVKKMQTPAVSATLFNELMPMAENLKEKYNTLIEHRRKKNAPQKLIDQLFEEYHGLNERDYKKLQELGKRKDYLTGSEKTLYDKLLRTSLREGAEITPEKIDLVLKGELGDANPFNSFFEGYLYSADPVVGGFALYVKNGINEVMVNAQAKFNEFAMDMGDSLKEAGYNPTNIGELGRKVGFVDKIGRFNPETEKFEAKEVWTLLNPYKDYRLKLNQDNYALQEAQKQYALTGSEEDRKKLVDLRSEQAKHRRQFFHQEYKPEFYEREALLEQDDIGREAAYRRENLFERMRMLTEPSISQMDELQISDQLEQLWREYRQLYSKYDLNGNLKTGRDLEVAQRLRDYRAMSSDFYEFRERKGVFQESLAKYEQELIDQGIARDTDQFNVYRQQWINKNTRVKVKEEFYKRRAEILNRIEEITNKLPDQIKKKIFIREAWETILDLTTGFRDDDGQPVGTELSEGSIAKVKAKQEEIAESMKAFTGLSGLTPAEMTELSGYFHKLKQYKTDKNSPNLSQGERSRLEALIRKRDEMGLSANTKLELFSLFEELNGLQKKEATDYYTDIMTNWLSKLNTSVLVANGISSTVTPTNADQIIEDHIINKLLSQDEQFADWFNKNHMRKKRYDKNLHEQVETWERLYVWNVIRPEDEKYYETTALKDEQGNVTEQIQGVPSNKYFTRVVKDKWRNTKNWDPNKGLVTTDNKREWLPRLDVKDNPYINQAYFDLQKSDPKMFTVLQKLTAHHLKNQEGLGIKNRLYLDFPRFRKTALEVLQTRKIARVAGDIGEDKFPMLNILIQRVKNFFRRSKDDAESGFNYKDEFNLVRADMFDDEVSSIPIAGLYDIDLDDVSTDITHSMMRYMFSAEHQKKLVQMNPMAQALKSIVNDPMNKVKDLDRINKFNFIHRGIKTYLNKKGKYVRADAINNFIEREFEGQTQAGWTKDMPTLNNLSTLLFKRAAFGFFALNIPSAVKNAMGAKFQGQIEALAGKYMSTASFAQGEAWAFNTMGQISFGIYERGPKSLNMQMVEIFDAIQGRFEEKFGESMSRTIASDTANMSWLYNFRKWTESQATLQQFAGMMYHQKVQQDGKDIPYIEAWQVKDGKIQLKPGIDPEWGITYNDKGEMKVGTKFKAKKNQMQQIMNNLQGAYSKFDQPEMQRYLAWRFISFLRRFFTTMAVNRWGKFRYNPGLGDVHEGYYVTTMKLVKRLASKDMAAQLANMTPDEKRAFIKTASETLMLLAISLLMGPLFGWDPKDKDKYTKLRDKSGALPFLGLTEEDPDHPFEFGGWMSNQGLQLAMQVRSENEQFLPWPQFGLDDYAGLLDLKSLAFGPTLDTYQKIFTLGIQTATDNPNAYYRRRIGPYKWQQEGGSKLVTYLAKTLGMTGGSLDPVMAIKNFQGIQARGK